MGNITAKNRTNAFTAPLSFLAPLRNTPPTPCPNQGSVAID